MNYYIPKYFRLEEWFPERFLQMNKVKGDYLWTLISPQILWTYDQLRKEFGKIIMNDYPWGGKNQYRGYRPPACRVGAWKSRHKACDAGDSVFERYNVEEIRQDILSNPNKEQYKHITCMEEGMPWLHIDCRNWDKRKHGILLV